MKKISVVISSYNRREKITLTLDGFLNQSLPLTDYEIVVVDNGSEPPLALPAEYGKISELSVVRFEKNRERSIARNAGVEIARGEYVVISDDDMIISPDFLKLHLEAHQNAENLLVIGRVLLPPERLSDAGIEFRQRLELQGAPVESGYVETDNFCTAQNMSIRRDAFLKLGGFDDSMTGIEDQDFAIRHTRAGGEIYYLFEALALHNDDFLEFSSFCRRQEKAALWGVKFGQRYPERSAIKDLMKINGPVKFGREPLAFTARKLVKGIFAARPLSDSLLLTVTKIARILPRGRVLDYMFKFALGVHIQRGFRAGLIESDLAESSYQSKRYSN